MVSPRRNRHRSIPIATRARSVRPDDAAVATGFPGSSVRLRKSSLRYDREGEDLNRQVALAALWTVSVMLTGHVIASEEEPRTVIGRIHRRIVAGPPPEAAERYGSIEASTDRSALDRRGP